MSVAEKRSGIGIYNLKDVEATEEGASIKILLLAFNS